MAGNFQQAEKDISLRQNNHSQKHNQFFRPGWLLPHLSLVPHNCTTSSFKRIYCRWIVLIVSRQTRVTLSSLSHSHWWLTYPTAETEKDKEWQAMTDSECVSEASTTLSLDLCPDFIVSVVGQASFLFHISQQFLPICILEGRRECWIKIKRKQVSLHM